MAKATKNVETVETVTGYTLELTVEEAQFLRDHLGRAPFKNTADDGIISRIYGALRAAGLHKRERL